MRPGTHTRADGSFARSASTQTVKGAGLLAVAVVIGLVLLHTAPRNTTSVRTTTTSTTRAPRPAAGPSATPAPGPSTTVKPVTHPTDQVHVLVANAATVVGLGGKVRGQLSGAGYNTDKPAINATPNVTATTIYFVPGFQGDALLMAGTLSVNPSSVLALPSPAPVPAADLAGVDILVLAGPDLAGGSSSTQGPGSTVSPSATQPSGPSGGTTPTTIRHNTTTIPRSSTTTEHTTTTTGHTAGTAGHVPTTLAP